MYSSNYIIQTILACGLVTWLSRVLPILFLKKFNLSKGLSEYLSYVPIVIMSAMWFSSLFIQDMGQLPKLNTDNFIASIPTVISAVLTKNLLVIVLVGMLSLALLRMV